MNKVREEVAYGEYVAPGVNKPSRSQAAGFDRVPVVIPNLSTQVASVVRSGLIVVVNFSQQFDSSAPRGYALVMSGTTVNGALTWDCKVGAAAQPLLNTVASTGATVGVPLPLKWAPSACRDS
jgi:hypothetical protein